MQNYDFYDFGKYCNFTQNIVFFQLFVFRTTNEKID